ncbi:MAG: NPCBM/NEW2 domain-containing protein, partial [Armatimonadota bacterium]|nr:NPCBM/NEW2 domain-containing protein [Armatimonadota bacterium]
GRVFEVASVMGWAAGEYAVVFSNREGFDLFEAWIGFKGGGERRGKIRFGVQGDGEPLFESPWMEEKDKPIKVSVSIKGYTGIRLTATVEGADCCRNIAVFANPVFVKLPPTIPLVVSPSLNEKIAQDTPLAWRKVGGATGYLLELQCVSLKDANDEADENRFLALRFPAETTLYNFNVNKMPKGKWRWRVHALDRTGFLGQMDEWRPFSSE